jgi:hypothetical protein
MPGAAAQAQAPLPFQINPISTSNATVALESSIAFHHASGQTNARATAWNIDIAQAPAVTSACTSSQASALVPAAAHPTVAAPAPMPGPPSTPGPLRLHEEDPMSPETLAMLKKFVAKGQTTGRSRLTPIFQTLLDSMMVDPSPGPGNAPASAASAPQAVSAPAKNSRARPKMKIVEPEPKATADLFSDGYLSDLPSASESNPPLDPESETAGTGPDRTRKKKAASGRGRGGQAGGAGAGSGAGGNTRAKVNGKMELVEGKEVSDCVIPALR